MLSVLPNIVSNSSSKLEQPELAHLAVSHVAPIAVIVVVVERLIES